MTLSNSTAPTSRSASRACGRSATLGGVSSTPKNSAIFADCWNRTLTKPTACSRRAISMVAKLMKATISPIVARPRKCSQIAKQENRQNRQRRRGAAGDGDEGPPGENGHLRRDDVIDDAVQRMRLAFDARKALHHRDVAKRIRRMFGERRIVALDLTLQIFRASQDEARHEIKDHDKRHEQRAEPPIDEQRRRQQHEERNEGRAVLAKERQPQPRHGVGPVEHDL